MEVMCNMSIIVESVEYEGWHDVYDIEVKLHHNFIASQICVHNSAEPKLS